MGATDAPREPTEVGLEAGNVMSAEMPNSASNGTPDWEGSDSEESEGTDGLEGKTVPTHAIEGSDAGKEGANDGLEGKTEMSGRRLRPATSDESQGDKPPKKQGKSAVEHADGDIGASRHLKLNASNGSDPEAPPRKIPKMCEKIGVDRVARPLRQRAASAPPFGDKDSN